MGDPRDVSFVMSNTGQFRFRRMSSEDDPVFTDSALQYYLRTLWAKLTMPKTRIRIQGALSSLVELAGQLVNSAGLLVVGLFDAARGAASKVKSKPDRKVSSAIGVDPRRGASQRSPSNGNGSGSNVIQPRSLGRTITPTPRSRGSRVSPANRAQNGPPKRHPRADGPQRTAAAGPPKRTIQPAPPKPAPRAAAPKRSPQVGRPPTAAQTSPAAHTPGPGSPTSKVQSQLPKRRPQPGAPGSRPTASTTNPGVQARPPAASPSQSPKPKATEPIDPVKRPPFPGRKAPEPAAKAPGASKSAEVSPEASSGRPEGFQAAPPVERQTTAPSPATSAPRPEPSPGRPQPYAAISTTGRAQVPMGPAPVRESRQHRPFLNEPERVSPYGRSPDAIRAEQQEEAARKAAAGAHVVDPSGAGESPLGPGRSASATSVLDGTRRAIASLFSAKMRPYRLAAVAAALVSVIVLAPKSLGLEYGALLNFASRIHSGDTAGSSSKAVSAASVSTTTSSPVARDASGGEAGALAGVGEWMASQYQKVADLLARPLVADGARVVVADLEVGSELPEDLGRTLALVLEEELIQADRYVVLRRERARAALGAHGEGLNLSRTQALIFAAGNEASAIITGSVVEATDDRLELRLAVMNADGETLYEVEAAASEADLVGTASGRLERIRRRLGESGKEIEAGPRAPILVGGSIEAIQHYAEARAALFNGHYNSAIRAAAEAVQEDTSFALAYRILGDAHALKGQRRSARQALDRSWHFRARLTERERLRLNADRAALNGDHQEAIIAYERLFTRYRDDVLALKSQAILKEMLGTTGGGLGNLELARSLDATDWPPLSRVARYFGYRGNLPQLD